MTRHSVYREKCMSSAGCVWSLTSRSTRTDLASISRTAGLSRAEAVFERCR